jgi:uncharacterized protein YndB with AHSA1/START domain
MAAYSFLTTWCVDAPIQRVWDLIYDVERYPEWWKGVRKVTQLEPGDENGLGALNRLEWRSKLPYTVEFDTRVTRSQPPHLLAAQAQRRAGGDGNLAPVRGRRRHRGRLQLGRLDDAPLDESHRAARAARVRVEPRLRHA